MKITIQDIDEVPQLCNSVMIII